MSKSESTYTDSSKVGIGVFPTGPKSTYVDGYTSGWDEYSELASEVGCHEKSIPDRAVHDFDCAFVEAEPRKNGAKSSIASVFCSTTIHSNWPIEEGM